MKNKQKLLGPLNMSAEYSEKENDKKVSKKTLNAFYNIRKMYCFKR